MSKFRSNIVTIYFEQFMTCKCTLISFYTQNFYQCLHSLLTFHIQHYPLNFPCENETKYSPTRKLIIKNVRYYVQKGLYRMKKWWYKKRKNQSRNSNYTFWDFVLDVLTIIPELLFLPFRLIFWLLRGIGRLFSNLFDFI